MRIVADTNLLVRAAVQDDPEEAQLAARALGEAELIVIGIPVLCEFVRVLSRVYGMSTAEIAGAIRELLANRLVHTHRPAAEAGLKAMEAGADFADGAIAFEGRLMGGEQFVTFDRRAAAALRRNGVDVMLLERGA